MHDRKCKENFYVMESHNTRISGTVKLADINKWAVTQKCHLSSTCSSPFCVFRNGV